MICSGHFCNSNKKTQNRSTKDNYIEHAVEKIQTKKMTCDFIRIFLSKDIICFLDSTSQLLNFLAIRGYTWHKIEKQRYNDDATVVNNIKTQQKQNKFIHWAASQKRFLLCL